MEGFIYALAVLAKLPSQLPLIMLLCFYGLLSKHRQVFYRVIPFFLLAIIANFVLKWWFQMPLPNGVNSSSFAFPSGHMSAAFVFYGLLLLHFFQWRWVPVFLIIMASTGWELCYWGYHYPIDVFGAVVSASTMLILYKYFLMPRSILALYYLFSAILLGYWVIHYINPNYPEVMHQTLLLASGWFVAVIFSQGIIKPTQSE